MKSEKMFDLSESKECKKLEQELEIFNSTYDSNDIQGNCENDEELKNEIEKLDEEVRLNFDCEQPAKDKEGFEANIEICEESSSEKVQVLISEFLISSMFLALHASVV